METSNIKIAYDPNFLSKEEIDKINGDNNRIELIEHSLNSNAPKNGLIHSTILLIFSSIPGNIASSFIYDLIKLELIGLRRSMHFGLTPQMKRRHL